MVTVVQRTDPTAGFGRKLAEGLNEGIEEGTKRYEERSDELAIQNSIKNLGDNPSARQILDAITNTKTHNSAAKQTALKNWMGVAEFEELQRKAKAQEDIETANINAKKEEKRVENEAERKKVKAIVNQLDLPDDKKAALGESLSQKSAEELLVGQLKPKEAKQTHAQKVLEEQNVKEYVDLVQELPQLESNAADIDYAEELSNDLGKFGTVKAMVGLSGKATELEGVGFTLIKPIVKIFNPSGPIAQKKLKDIQDKYAIRGTDAPWVRQGKIDALRRFNSQALKRGQDRLALFKKYDGNPPINEVEVFDAESNTMSDAMLDYELVGEEVNVPGFPPAHEYKDEDIESADGSTYHSDGTKWIKR